MRQTQKLRRQTQKLSWRPNCLSILSLEHGETPSPPCSQSFQASLPGGTVKWLDGMDLRISRIYQTKWFNNPEAFLSTVVGWMIDPILHVSLYLGPLAGGFKVPDIKAEWVHFSIPWHGLGPHSPGGMPVEGTCHLQSKALRRALYASTCPCREKNMIWLPHWPKERVRNKERREDKVTERSVDQLNPKWSEDVWGE